MHLIPSGSFFMIFSSRLRSVLWAMTSNTRFLTSPCRRSVTNRAPFGHLHTHDNPVPQPPADRMNSVTAASDIICCSVLKPYCKMIAIAALHVEQFQLFLLLWDLCRPHSLLPMLARAGRIGASERSLCASWQYFLLAVATTRVTYNIHYMNQKSRARRLCFWFTNIISQVHGPQSQSKKKHEGFPQSQTSQI